MYNRYIPQSASFTPVEPEPEAKGEKKGLHALLSLLRPKEGDTGDLLLLLILLLVLLDGEDNELVLILGLALFLGLK